MTTRTKPKTKKAKVPRPPRDPTDIGYKTHLKTGEIKKGRTIEVFDYLAGTSITEIDVERSALPPGKRISRNGNVYWENRANRADLNPVAGL